MQHREQDARSQKIQAMNTQDIMHLNLQDRILVLDLIVIYPKK